MRWLYLLPLVLALFFRGPAEAGEAPELSLPVDCPMGEICFIQNHFDRDPDPGFRDYVQSLRIMAEDGRDDRSQEYFNQALIHENDFWTLSCGV